MEIESGVSRDGRRQCEGVKPRPRDFEVELPRRLQEHIEFVCRVHREGELVDVTFPVDTFISDLRVPWECGGAMFGSSIDEIRPESVRPRITRVDVAEYGAEVEAIVLGCGKPEPAGRQPGGPSVGKDVSKQPVLDGIDDIERHRAGARGALRFRDGDELLSRVALHDELILIDYWVDRLARDRVPEVESRLPRLGPLVYPVNEKPIVRRGPGRNGGDQDVVDRPGIRRHGLRGVLVERRRSRT